MRKLLKALLWLCLAPFKLVWWIIKLPFRFLGWLFRPVVERFKRNPIYRFLNEVPEEHPLTEALGVAIGDPAGILDHLEAVRKHLLRALVALSLAVVISFTFTQNLINFLATPVGGLEQLQAIEVTESLSVFMKVALIAGIALATPYIAFEVWLFFAPGVMPRAKVTSLLSIPFALLFFLGGMAFAYYVMLPTALPFLLDFLGIAARLRPGSYFDFITSLMFWIGIAFEFPLVIFGISAMGFLEPKSLLKQWRLAVVLIAVVSAMITPTVDPVNMALVMAPMIGLYFLSIIFSWLARATNGKNVKAQPSA